MIKVGLDQRITNPVAMVRYLIKHPDVDLVWIYNGGKTAPVAETLPALTGDCSLSAVAEPQWGGIDLYIGPGAPGLEEAFLVNDSLKVIFTTDSAEIRNSLAAPAEIGLAEFNRKALVRGARVAYQPDVYTMLGALALMPLARNLLLGDGITGLMKLRSDNSAISPSPIPIADNLLQPLRSQVLGVLQTSFSAPLKFERLADSMTVVYANVSVPTKMNFDDLLKIYHDFYDDHRHIVLLDSVDICPEMVQGTNKTILSLSLAEDGRLNVKIEFDSLYKCGAGNALHLLNLLFGLDERIGF